MTNELIKESLKKTTNFDRIFFVRLRLEATDSHGELNRPLAGKPKFFKKANHTWST